MLSIFSKLKAKLIPGVYIVQHTMAREKNEKWGSEEQNEKEGKRGKEKEKGNRRKGKGGEWFFLLIYGTLLLIIVC